MTSSAMRAPRTLRWLGVLLVVLLACAAIAFFARTAGVRNGFFALELHFVLMAAADAINRLLRPRLDSARFVVSAAEIRMYRRLGVRAFMRALRAIGWTALVRNRKVFDGTRHTLAAYERATRESENAHLWLFAVSLLPIGWMLVHGWWDAVLWTGAMSILFHAYPVLLQRVQRARLAALLARARRTGALGPAESARPRASRG